MNSIQAQLKYLFYIIPVLCFFPFFTAPIALFLGIILAFFYKGQEVLNTAKITKYLLQISVVCMGFSMSVHEVVQTGRTGFAITIISVVVTMLLGVLLGKIFKIEKNTSTLIAGGTAICGGSAIAAIAPVIDAKNNQTSFALAVIFVLNAIALFIFPVIGHFLHMSQTNFGYWAAIAIHDTSSVVGACSAYGNKALQVGTTVKLTRTIWIIPLTLGIALFSKNKHTKIKIPWFILFFIIAIIVGSYAPHMSETNTHLSWLGKRGMIISLFFIGTSIRIEEVKRVGARAFLQGISLWFIVAILSLIAINRLF